MNTRTCRLRWIAAGLTIFIASVQFVSAAVALDTNRLQRLQRPANRPNVIFILADDLGYGDLGSYGQKKIKTPHLDQLAAEGMRFTSCYAGSTVCAPSRCTLLTGLHTGHARIRGNANAALGPDDLTVSEIFKKAGYRTAIFGKWGLGDEDSAGTPNKKGFDDWRGFLNQTHAHNYYPEYIWSNQEKFPLPLNQDGGKQQYVHDLFSVAAVNFIRIYHNQPFFLYLAYTIPHANNEEFKKSGNGMEIPDAGDYANEKWPEPEKNKAAMISRLDLHVGKIMETLRTNRVDQDTIVFFASDNGPHKEGGNDPAFFESHGGLRGIKRDLYEGGIRIPMIVRWPGKIKAGSTSDLPWAFWDFLPTATDILKVTTPTNIDGLSVLPTLLGHDADQKQHEFLYWEFHENGSKQAVRMGDWKGVRLAPGAALELYNLKSDLHETNNVAAKNPEIVARIEDYLKTARSESKEWPLKAPPPKKVAAPPKA